MSVCITFNIGCSSNVKEIEVEEATSPSIQTSIQGTENVDTVEETEEIKEKKKEFQFYLNSDKFLVEGQDVEILEDKRWIASFTTLEHAFGCVIRMNGTNQFSIEKNGQKIDIDGETQKMRGEEGKESDLFLEKKRGTWFASLQEIGEAFGYKIDLNGEDGTIRLVHESPDLILPPRYDTREVGRAPTVKNQGQLGTCWAVASSSAMEAYFLPFEQKEFSADHISLRNNYQVTQEEGGGYGICTSYLTGWQGPVWEADDPYGDGSSPEGLLPVKHVQGVVFPKAGNLDGIKQGVYKNGAVQSALYMDLDHPMSQSQYYKEQNQAYYYSGEEEQNHDIVIIGWDDTFPKEYFNGEVAGDGAFICQNSWGTSFGDKGVFYVSYYDSKIAEYNVTYTSIEETDNYDNIYQADLCGWTGQIGYQQSQGYFSNVYTAKGDEWLEAVGFYTTGEESEYEVYFVSNYEDTPSFSNMQFLQTGYVKESGYYTIRLKEALELSEGQKFAIIIKIQTQDSLYPIAIEYGGDEENEIPVDLGDGEGFVSSNGVQWMDTEDLYQANICLKTYTSKR